MRQKQRAKGNRICLYSDRRHQNRGNSGSTDNQRADKQRTMRAPGGLPDQQKQRQPFVKVMKRRKRGCSRRNTEIDPTIAAAADVGDDRVVPHQHDKRQVDKRTEQIRRQKPAPLDRVETFDKPE